MQTRLRVAGCRGMMKDAMVAVEHAWRQVLRGHRRAPEVPETLHEDASLEDVAVKRRADLIFKFAVSLSDGGRADRPRLPADLGGAFRAAIAGRAARRAPAPGTGTETESGGDATQILAAMARMQSALEEDRGARGEAGVEPSSRRRLYEYIRIQTVRLSQNAITKRAFYASTFGPVFVLARGLISFLGTPDATSDTSTEALPI